VDAAASGTQARAGRMMLTCVRRSRVVLAPRRWRQVSRICLRNDGGKQARSPGRARSKPLKPLRREGRVFRWTCGDYTRVLSTLHARLRVQRAPGFPCALCLRGWLMQRLGHIVPRDRGLVPAIGITSLRSTKATKRSPTTRLIVIPRESGVSSTQRPLGSDTGFWNTGSPAFRG
jgi:hypothetical protein